jgi:hypothetical protein
MLASLTFVVIGLIQFSLVLHLHQSNAAQDTTEKESGDEEVNLNKEVLIPEQIEVQFHNRTARFNIKKIDHAAFYSTGSLFRAFNVVYWVAFI